MCGPARRRNGQANGSVSRLAPATVSIAVIQPKPEMIACTIGAKTNWPSEPPALTRPAAKERRSGGRRCSTEPIRIEKLPAPAPKALTTPSTAISCHSEATNGTSAVPTASITPPNTITRPGPKRSARAPKNGCEKPQVNCPIAIARLIDTMPKPVA